MWWAGASRRALVALVALHCTLLTGKQQQYAPLVAAARKRGAAAARSSRRPNSPSPQHEAQPFTPLDIASALGLPGGGRGRAASRPAVSCGVLVCVFDSVACEASPDARGCRAAQLSAAAALQETAGHYGGQEHGGIVLGSIDVSHSFGPPPAPPPAGRSVDNLPAAMPADGPKADGRAFAAAFSLRELRQPQLWFFSPAGHRPAVRAGLAVGPRSDVDTAAERLFSQLLVRGKRMDLSKVSRIDTEMVLSAMNMRCNFRKFTSEQVETIKLHRGLLDLRPGEKRAMLRAGAELNPLDSLSGFTAAEEAIRSGNLARLRELMALGLPLTAELLHFVVAPPVEMGPQAPAGLSGKQYIAGVQAVLEMAPAAMVNSVFGALAIPLVCRVALKWDKCTMGKNAADNEFLRVIVMLLERGADPQAADVEGRSIHHIAAASHNYALLKMLLEDYPPVVPLQGTRHGQTLLHFVTGHFANVVRLTKGSMDGIDTSMYHQGWDNRCLKGLENVTAFHRAVPIEGRRSTRAAVWDIDSNPETWPDQLRGNGIRRRSVIAAQNSCAFNAAMTALVLDFVRAQAVKLSSSNGWRPLVHRELARPDFQGCTALHIAAAADSGDAAELLVEEAVAVAAGQWCGSGESSVATLSPAALATVRGSSSVLAVFAATDSGTCAATIHVPTTLPVSPAGDRRPTQINLAVERWANASGWRQPPEPGDGDVAPGLQELREWGCDAAIDVRDHLSWAEFRDE